MKQYLLPLAGTNHCQQCYKAISADLAAKSKQRCEGQVFCFSHQMYYTSQKLKSKRLAKVQHPKTQSVSPLA